MVDGVKIGKILLSELNFFLLCYVFSHFFCTISQALKENNGKVLKVIVNIELLSVKSEFFFVLNEQIDQKATKISDSLWT